MSATPSDDVVYAASGGVGAITLNRPEKLNALRIETYEALISALREAGDDPSVGVVTIRGAGRAFCAGGDIEMAQTVLTSEHEARKHFFGRMIEVSKLVLALDKPVVCAVHGACVGGGAELITFADLVLAGESAFFLFNGTEIGGGNWWGGTQLLPLLVGLRRAEEILYLSRRVDAEEAERIGLVTRVVPDDELAAAFDEVCERLLDLSEDGLRLTKAGLRSTKELLLAPLAAGAEMNVSALAKPGLHEAFAAFLDGRAMSWRELRTGAPT
jgi:enoyl-CoA hydratase/carnithine racemase